MAGYDIQTRTIPGRTLVAITRHVHAHEAGRFFSDAFARLRAAGPGIEGIAGCPFVVYYGEVSEDSDGPVELCRPVAADPGPTRRSRPPGPDRALPRGGVHPGRDEGHGLAGAGARRRRARGLDQGASAGAGRRAAPGPDRRPADRRARTPRSATSASRCGEMRAPAGMGYSSHAWTPDWRVIRPSLRSRTATHRTRAPPG